MKITLINGSPKRRDSASRPRRPRGKASTPRLPRRRKRRRFSPRPQKRRLRTRTWKSSKNWPRCTPRESLPTRNFRRRKKTYLTKYRNSPPPAQGRRVFLRNALASNGDSEVCGIRQTSAFHKRRTQKGKRGKDGDGMREGARRKVGGALSAAVLCP